MSPIRLSTAAAVCLCAFAAAGASAATLRWPGPAPCNSSLQACIDAAVPGDLVELATSAPIDESLLVRKSLRLRRAPGHVPRFDSHRGLSFSIPADTAEPAVQVEVDGLRFERGALRVVNAASIPIQVLLRNNVFDGAPNSVAAAITLRQDGASGDFEFEVAGNRLDLRSGTGSGSGISLDGVGNGNVVGRIRYNHLLLGALPAPSAGIKLYRLSRPMAVDVHANRIEGDGFEVGIGAWRDGAAVSGPFQFVFVHGNVVLGQRGLGGLAAAISLSAGELAMLANVFNNTVGWSDRGLLGRADAGTLMLPLHGSLFAYNAIDVELSEIGVTFEARNNLSHGNGQTRLSGTDGLVTAAPRLAFDGFRLRPGSPAIDAAGPPVGVSGTTPLDVDGLARSKGLTVDIGAHEYAAVHLLHSVSGSSSVSVMSHPALDGRPDAHPLVTHNWNPPAHPGVYVDHPISVQYDGSQWLLVNDAGLPLPTHAAFNVFLPGTPPRGHLSTGSNTLDDVSMIDDPELDADLFLLAAHERGGYGAGSAQPLLPRFGLARADGRWNIVGNASLPTPRGYTLYAQPHSANAFVHTTAAGNIVSNWSVIDHPALNGRRCARLQVTPRMDAIAPPGRLGVWYDGARWAIYHENIAAMPAGVRVFVLYDPAQVEGCSRRNLFRDGMEAVPYRARPD
jgi:hypothetical protein